MSTETPDRTPGLIEAIRIDLERLHASWMGLVFPGQREGAHSVLGRWTPRTTAGMIKYRLWGALGVFVLGFAYPLAVLGLATRFHVRRIDRAAASLGLLGVALVSLLVWSALTLFARLRFSFEGFVAVAAAGGVATVSAVLAVVFSRIGGRFTTVLLAYPFSVTALFLPPVVAALYSPSLAGVVFPSSNLIAIWLLEHVLVVGGVGEYLTSRFRLSGFAYVGMWFGLAVPLGWVLGVLVTLADVIRPSGRADSETEPTAAGR